MTIFILFKYAFLFTVIIGKQDVNFPKSSTKTKDLRNMRDLECI